MEIKAGGEGGKKREERRLEWKGNETVFNIFHSIKSIVLAYSC